MDRIFPRRSYIKGNHKWGVIGSKECHPGIPKGSMLGPIRFVLYINDLPDVIKHGSIRFLFADETKIYQRINCSKDCEDLQEDIKAMQLWSEKWLFCFHPDKCNCMRIGNSDINLYAYRLKENGKAMKF